MRKYYYTVNGTIEGSVMAYSEKEAKYKIFLLYGTEEFKITKVK